MWVNRNSIPGHWMAPLVVALDSRGVNPTSLIVDDKVAATEHRDYIALRRRSKQTTDSGYDVFGPPDITPVTPDARQLSFDIFGPAEPAP
jgi:hypothetical protein